MIIKEPDNQKKHLKNICFTKAGRVAFSHMLKTIFSATDKKILMPSYIGETDKEGSGVFDPVRENKVPFGFYLIKEDLSANMEDLESKILSGQYKVLLIIHYFGFVQNDMEKLCSICKKNDVILIEDCAHSFFSSYRGTNIGEWGDLSFFSIHKIIAAPDGGYFRINNDKIEIAEINYDSQNLKAITLEQFIRTDYEKINTIRRLNYQKYLDSFLNTDLLGIRPLYPELPIGIIPLNFPIIIKDGYREKLYFKLIERGIVTCSLYYRMVKEIDRNLFPVSYEISSSILNLPTHQDTNFTDIDTIIFRIKESIAEIK